MLLRAERHGMHGARFLDVELASRNDQILTCPPKWYQLRSLGWGMRTLNFTRLMPKPRSEAHSGLRPPYEHPPSDPVTLGGGMVGGNGLEPMASAMSTQRSNH